jgi:hypothetical protein
MNGSTQDINSKKNTSNENIFMEVAMTTIFVAIIVFSVLFLTGV